MAGAGGRGESEREQFAARGRALVLPRTLVFLRHGDDVLLLRGAPTKRLWAGRYNGLGGQVEPGETILAAALREVAEEAGLVAGDLAGLALRALIAVEGEGAANGVLLCVFVGAARTRAVAPSREGTPEWIPIAELDRVDLVDGCRLLPRLLEADRLLFGHQRVDAAGRVSDFTLG